MYNSKTTMDKDTIVYILDDKKYGNVYSRAYNREYIKRNYASEYKRIEKANRIYYKVGNGFDTWIDYRKAIQNNKGTYDERINLALKNPDMKLSEDLREIPTTLYTDNEGYENIIPPNDGMINKAYWLEREDRGIFEPVCKPTIRNVGKEKEHSIDLMFEFSVDVDDALITLNGFFKEYEQLSPRKILYRNIGAELPKITIFNEDKPDNTTYDYNIKVYKWKGLKKLPEKRPIERTEKNTIKFEQEITRDGLLIYNGLIYDYKIVNNHEIEVCGIDADKLKEFILDEFMYIKFVSVDGRDIVCNFKTNAIINNLANEAAFVKSVDNSLITYNGVDMDYEVMDNFTVKYPQSLFGTREVPNDANIVSISFYYGRPNEGACLPNDYTPPDYSDIINRYDEYIKDLMKKIMNDYQDELDSENFKTGTFKLKYKPIRDTVSLFINGIRYDKDDHFKYDEASNTVTWKFSRAEGGFDLRENFNYTAMYDFYFEENGITNPTEFLKQYYMNLKH